MATIKQVKEGFYLISWVAQNLNLENPPAVRVDLKEIFPNYSCNLLTKRDADGYSLKMEILDQRCRKPIFPIEFKKVEATKDDVQLQKMVQCHSPLCHQDDQTSLIWLALWPLSSRRHVPGRPSSSAKFEIVIKTLSTSADSIKCRKRLKTIHHTINLFRENEAFGNVVTFTCGNEVIKAHPSVLAVSSPVFASMFQHDDFQEKKVIEIQDIKSSVFEQLVQYFYIQDTDLDNVDDVAGLLVAAEKYCVDSLKEKCAAHLADNLTVENATRCLILAHLHKAPNLCERALNFMARNAKTICYSDEKDWIELIKNYPDLTFQVMQRMADNI